MTDESIVAKYASHDFLTYEDFRQRALDAGMSPYEKVGFPDEYRKEYEANIFADILAKLPALRAEGRRVLNIGCGCSDNVRMLIAHCEQHGHALHLLDSAEMLSCLPESRAVTKIQGRFPDNLERVPQAAAGGYDAIIVYSVLHNAMIDANPFSFVDAAVGLLAPGGALLIGDLPNISKRNRFFASETGVAYHQSFTKSDERPTVEPYQISVKRIDDGMVFGLMLRYRNFGFETYLLPESSDIHFSNRREDMLIVRN